MHRSRLSALGLLVTLGIVFGDIGTSPLYVMKAITVVNPDFDADYITGAVSCVIWALTLQTTVKYVLIAKTGISDQNALGLDTSNVSVEAVPLIINDTPPRRIRPM